MDIDLLNKLSSCNGISSFETEVSNIIESELESSMSDGIGSVIVSDESRTGLKLMFASHMDEVGFIVENVEGNFLKLRMIGSLWTHLVIGQLYTLTNCKGEEFLGVVSSPSSHAMDPNKKKFTIPNDKIYLDLGMSYDEIIKNNIGIGDMVTPYSKFEVIGNGKYLLNKAFDDRVACYIGLEILKKKINRNCDLSWAFTVQEEPGLRGARTTTNMIKPDVAFAIDTTLAGDTPFDKNIVKLGGGVALSFIDSNTLAHRGLMRWVEDICKKNNIRYQYAVFNRGGTDSGNIHKSINGIINMTISIPIRYMHTNHSIIHQDDIVECIKLVEAIIGNMNINEYNKIMEAL